MRRKIIYSYHKKNNWGIIMLIKAIPEINENCTSVIESNKMRCMKIQDNLKDLNLVDNIFSCLQNAIESEDELDIVHIISNKLFFEQAVEGLEELIIATYKQHGDKYNLMQQLKKSYVIRGVKGVQFAWMPILIKRG